MKKMFAKFGLTSLLSVAFLLGGLLFCTNSAQAQTLTGTPQNGPIKTTGTWKSVDNAKTALQTEINALDYTLANTTPGNGPKLKAQFYIYKGIMTSLQNGVSVPDAAVQNYYSIAPGPNLDHSSSTGLTAGDWSAIYNEMLALLQ